MKQQPGVVLVSSQATTPLGELLWLGTNTQFCHPNDGVFKSVGSYYLWLKTVTNPSVRFYSWEVGFKMVSNEPGVDVVICDADHAKRISTVVCMLLKSYGLLDVFTHTCTSLTFDNVPTWYQQLLLRLRAELMIR